MKEKKKLLPLWLIPTVVIIALILWCIYFPMNLFTGLDEDAEPSVATVMVHVFDGENPRADITDPQQLEEIMAQLKAVRCRFFGWSNIMNISAEKPTIDLYITGYEGETPFGFHLSVNGRNEIHIWQSNICLRAKDAALYDYLTALLPQE